MSKTKKSPGARDHVITLRLDDEERRKFNRVARRLGLSVSAMLRHLLAKAEPPHE